MNPRNSPRAAIVLAAGKGTRMKSARAKVLHAVNGKAMVIYPIRRALELGCDPVVVVVGHQHEAVRAALEAEFPKAPLRFVLQKEQLGTGHAVLSARRALAGHRGRILIACGDAPLLSRETLQRLRREAAKAPVVGLSMFPEDPHGYGRIVRDASGQVLAVVEQKDLEGAQRDIRECNAGIYDCDAAFLWKVLRTLGTDNAQGEYYLTDIVAAAARAGRPARMIEAPPEEVLGINDRAELARAAAILRRRVAERHLRAGVSIVDPDSTYIEEEVRLAPDVTVEPHVSLRGATRVGSGSVVGFGSHIQDSRIGENVSIRPYTVMEGARIGDGAVVGPFARLRPETELAEGVRIGNFVETKKARLGAGAKVNHLSYVGDAVVGARSNIGAGTITCNYDGKNKNTTVIGEDVFIGSDTQLLAPVRVGDGAYVGAGTTLVADVPPGALALSRERQVVKEGWAARRAAERKAAKVAPKARAVAARSARKKKKD